MNIKQVNEFFDILSDFILNPTTELQYKNPFELLVAVILSAQATDISVNKVTKSLFDKHSSAKDIVNLGEENLKHFIKSIGLYKMKAKNIIQTCKILLEKYDGNIPNTREGLEYLPGVGRKTANVILNTIFKMPVIAVDTHIFRLSNRIPIAKGKNVLEVENNLYKIVPKKYLMNAHHLLILFGRYTCKAKNPACDVCLVSHLCSNKYPSKF